MSKFFESNLKLLETYDPLLAGRLRFYTPAGCAVVFPTPQNTISLRFERHGRPVLLHSAQDPIREAERWIAPLSLQSPYNVLIAGCGLLYHAYQLVKNHHRTLKTLVVLEKEMEIVHTVFTHVDLSMYLLTQNTFFLVDPTPSEIRAFFNAHLTSFTLDELTVIEHPASIGLNPDSYAEARRVIDECLQSGEMLLRTKVQLGGSIQENVIRNIPALLANPNVTAFRSLLPRIPAFVVGAGPSLDRNVEALARIGERGVIIAVDTVLSLLLAKGIQPHLVVSTDPTPLNLKHFESVSDPGSTILVFSPTVNYQIPKKLKGSKVSIPLPASRLLPFLNLYSLDGSHMKTGINVGQTCFNLARYMGCDPIVLTGLDFSFSPKGGTTHASGTALRRNITLSGTPGKMKVELIGDKPELEEFDPILIPGNLEDRVATNKFWLAYLRSMEEEIAQTNARTINCSAGGAKIEGAGYRPLDETIETVCTTDRQVGSTLQSAVGFFFGTDSAVGRSLLQECEKVFRMAVERADGGIRQLSILKEIIESPSPDPAIVRDCLNAVTGIHKALIQDHKVYAILDEAADRVLSPFLRQENRITEEMALDETARKTIERYEPYFTGMKDICLEFNEIARETLVELEKGRINSTNLW